jgi:hypothetical protein
VRWEAIAALRFFLLKKNLFLPGRLSVGIKSSFMLASLKLGEMVEYVNSYLYLIALCARYYWMDFLKTISHITMKNINE